MMDIDDLPRGSEEKRPGSGRENTESFHERNYDKPLFLNGQEPVGHGCRRVDKHRFGPLYSSPVGRPRPTLF